MSASWLSALLRAAGHALARDLDALDVDLWQRKAHADLYRLTLAHAVGPSLPSRFICKISRPEAATATVRRRRWKEHEFYASVVPAMADPPAPPVFATSYDPAAHRSLLLLEDLSGSHERPPSPLPPTPGQLRGDVDCLADLHAWWWDHGDLAGARHARHAAWIRQRSAAARRLLVSFLHAHSPYLPAAIGRSLETAVAGWPTILRRASRPPLTVVHGDAHPWNFLTPRPGTEGRTRLLDWEAWSIEPGPHDLVSLIALHLPLALRREIEDEAIARYVARLRERGVAYDLDIGRTDYRLAVARRMLAPVGMWSRGSDPRTWWPVLERVSLAFQELRCEEVL